MKKMICLLLFVSCAAYNPKYFTIENRSIPPEIGLNSSEVLLCLLLENSYDDYFKDAIKNYYKGNYLFITNDELEAGEYSDTEKYRYMLVRYKFKQKRTFEHQTKDGMFSTTYAKSNIDMDFWKFYFKDRNTDTDYFAERHAQDYQRYIDAFVPSIESARSQNALENE